MKKFTNIGVRFSGLVQKAPTFDKFLNDSLGYTVNREDNDWVIPASDKRLRSGIRDFLKFHHSIPICGRPYRDVASQMIDVLSSDFDDYYNANPFRYKFQFSERNTNIDAYDALTKLITAPPDKISPVIENELLPLMAEKLGALSVTPISVDAPYGQSLLSLYKFVFVLGRNSPDKAKELVLEKEALLGILPTNVATLSYVSALTRCAPLAFTLPAERIDCAFHFQGKAMWQFKDFHTQGFLQLFHSELSPASSEAHILPFSGLRGMNEKNIWRYLRVVTNGLNRLLKHVYDPRTYVSPQSIEFDAEKALKAISGIHLLFADLLAFNNSTNAHSRINFAFSALDKFANLKKYLGDDGRTEGAIFRGFVKNSQRNFLVKTVNDVMAPHSEELASAFSELISSP